MTFFYKPIVDFITDFISLYIIYIVWNPLWSNLLKKHQSILLFRGIVKGIFDCSVKINDSRFVLESFTQIYHRNCITHSEK